MNKYKVRQSREPSVLSNLRNEEAKIMKKVLMFALALVISVAFVSTVFAQTQPADDKSLPGKGPAGAAPAKPGPKVEMPKGTKYAGQVTKVEGSMVTVKGKKDEKTFDVANAKFKGYKAAEDIKVGDKVGVIFNMADGKAVAAAVAKAAAPPKATYADQPAPGAGPGGAQRPDTQKVPGPAKASPPGKPLPSADQPAPGQGPAGAPKN
jgi:hypothetical protein